MGLLVIYPYSAERFLLLNIWGIHLFGYMSNFAWNFFYAGQRAVHTDCKYLSFPSCTLTKHQVAFDNLVQPNSHHYVTIFKATADEDIFHCHGCKGGAGTEWEGW